MTAHGSIRGYLRLINVICEISRNMKRLLFFAFAAVMLAGCSPKIVSNLTSAHQALPQDVEVVVLGPETPGPDNAELLGQIKIGDSGFTTKNGTYPEVLELAKEEARKAGGNVVEQAAASGSPTALRYAMSLLDGKVRKLPQRALCYAARHGHFELVETILNTYRPELNCCIPVSVQHSYPYEDLVGASGVIEVEESSPLIAAIASGNEQLVNFLIEWEADITFSTGEKRHLLTPARAAARRGQPRILKTLLNLDSSGEQDPLLLHQAAQNGHAECVRLLLQQGWDVNAEDPFTKLTPVQAACIRGTEAPGSVAWNYDSGCSHADCVRLLLQAGADVFFDRGRKAKSLALHAENPMFDCAGILWSSGSPLSEEEMLYPLHRAAELGSLSWVEELLPGAKSASVAESHRNPLFTVCNVGDSYLPYLEKHTPSPHRDCAAALQSKGLSIPMDDTRYLIQNGVNRRMYPFLGVEPVRGARH